MSESDEVAEKRKELAAVMQELGRLARIHRKSREPRGDADRVRDVLREIPRCPDVAVELEVVRRLAVRWNLDGTDAEVVDRIRWYVGTLVGRGSVRRSRCPIGRREWVVSRTGKSRRGYVERDIQEPVDERLASRW